MRMKLRPDPAAGRFTRRRRAPAAFLLAFPVAAVAAVAYAATITVDLETSTVDPGDGRCSLREAIHAANTDTPSGPVGGECVAGSGGGVADTIELSGNVTLTIVDNTGLGNMQSADYLLPIVTTDVIVQGNGFTIDGAGRVFGLYGDYYYPTEPKLSLNNLVLDNVSAYQLRGTLEIADSTWTHSEIKSGSPSGGAADKPRLKLDRTVMIDGIGIRNNGSSLELTDSVIRGGNGVSNCNGFLNCSAGSVVITRSEISGSSSTGVSFYGTPGRISNSTISGNQASGVAYYAADVTIEDSTIFGNGWANVAGYGYGSVELRRSIVAVGEAVADNCNIDTLIDGGDNRADDDTCGTIPNALTGVSPTLADNGGPGRTHRLLPGSTAIDAVGDCAVATDQRGFPRSDGDCDVGAFEYRGCDVPEGDPACEVCDNASLGAAVRLTSDPATSTAPVLLRAGDGFGLGWLDARSGKNEVWFSKLNARGGVTAAALQVSEDAGTSSALAGASNGSGFGFAWYDDRDGNPEIYFAALDGAGNGTGEDVRITTDPADSVNPWIGWSGTEYAVVWSDDRDGNPEIYFARLDPAGTPPGDPVRITQDPAVSTGPMIVWAGGAWGLLWQDQRDGNPEVYFARLAADGTKLSGDIRLTQNASVSDNARLVWNGDGYGVVWRDWVSGVAEFYFARLDGLGGLLAPAVALTTGGGFKGGPSLTWTGQEYAVAWQDQRDGNLEIYLARIDASGAEVDDELRFTTDPGDSRSASLTWGGTFYGAAWRDDRHGNPEILFKRLGCNCIDEDQDSYTSCEECLDTVAAVFPGAPEICDGFNNDCDAPDWPAVDPSEGDEDGDGVRPCAGDCDDLEQAVYPGAAEACDGLNNDCDHPDWPTPSTLELDLDADGFRPCSGDCDDQDPYAFPGVLEEYDGIDNDCDGDTDEGIPQEVFKLTASDRGTGDRFGYAVSVDGEAVLVGAYGDNVFGPVSGSAYVFERDGVSGGWSEAAKLIPSEGARQDRFGQAVSLSGEAALVGAFAFGQSGGVPAPGSAYIFERSAGGPDHWGQVARLTAPDGANNDHFGYSVGLDGAIAVVGAYRHNAGAGAAYVFRRGEGATGTWVQVAKLTASDEAGSFGFAVAVDGDTILVGARGSAAYVFERDPALDTWGEVARLVEDPIAAEGGFGTSASIRGATAVVGTRSGAAYIFERDGADPGVWGQVRWLAPEGVGGTFFGHSAAVDQEVAVIGAWADSEVDHQSGAAYLFERNAGSPGSWGPLAKVVASDAEPGDHFGFAVSVESGTIVVGAYEDDGMGSAYVLSYARPRCGDGLPEGPELCDDGNDVEADGCDATCLPSCEAGDTDLDGDDEADLCDQDDGLIYLVASAQGRVGWQAEPPSGSWNLYRGDLAILVAGGAYTQVPGSNPSADRQCGLRHPWTEDPFVPAPGEAAFWLVTGLSDGAEGTLGAQSTGAVRPNSAPCP